MAAKETLEAALDGEHELMLTQPTTDKISACDCR